jgi:hypothetical protein
MIIMPLRIAAISVLIVVGGLIPSPVWAQNTSFATAQNIVPGQPPLQVTMTTNFPGEFTYYVFGVVTGRSYCAEMVAGPAETTRVIAAGIFVFAANQTNEVALSNGLTGQEPLSGNNSLTGLEGAARTCWIAQTTEVNYIRAHKGLNAVPGSMTFQVRVIDTTLFSNWFFVGGDYAAFTLIRNTTSGAVDYTVRWRSAAGAIVGTSSGNLPGNGSVFVNARDFAGALAAGSGTVEIAHNSSGDALVASTTVLSATTGLSFDAPFMRRQAW